MSSFPSQTVRGFLDGITELGFSSDRYLILLDKVVRTATCTVEVSTNRLLSPNHPFLTMARARLTTTGTQPELMGGIPLSATTTYFIKRVASGSLTLHNSASDAASGLNPVEFSSPGSGTLTLTQQPFIGDDDLSVMVGQELTHLKYSRSLIVTIPPAKTVNGQTTRGPVFHQIQLAAGDAPMEPGWVVLIENGSPVRGNTTGSVKLVQAIPALTILPGETRAIDLLITQ
jgi:hypothetical protein